MKLKKVKISELGKIITGKTPPTSNPEYFGGKYPFITPADMHDRKYANSTERYLSKSGADLLKTKLLPTNSVAVSCIGWQMGKTIKITQPSFTNQQLNSIIPNEKVNPDYLYYLLCTKREELFSIGSAAGVRTPILNKTLFSEFKISIPKLAKQNEIASILSAFDDLISTNNRRIEILEEMARRIYRNWFVNFCYPGNEDDELVDSGMELGKIPEGWEVKNIIDLYDTSAGGTPSRKKDEYFDGKIPWIKTKELNDSFIQGTEETITKLGLDNSSAKLFPKNSVLVAMYGATVGQLGILDMDATTNQACCAVMKKEAPFDYSYIFFSLLDYRDKLIGLKQGAAQQNINQGIIKGFKILKPTTDILEEFQNIIYPLLDQIRVLKKKNDRLRETRDLLLPKLISGKIYT